MFVDPKMMNRLTVVSQHMVTQLTPNQQQAFWNSFAPLSKDPTTVTLLSIFLPVQFIYLGEIGLGLAFALTGYGCGIWYVVEWFLAGGRARTYNDKVAQLIVSAIKSSNH